MPHNRDQIMSIKLLNMKTYFVYKWLVLVLLIFIDCNCFSQNTDYVNSLKKAKSKEIESLMKKYAVTGLSIALIDDQKTVWAQGFGYSDLENKIQTNSKTNYRICSMSKVFTASAIMKLSQEGKINIDTSYNYYDPKFSIKSHNSEDIKAITPRNLMSHYSGLPGDLYKGCFSKEPEYYTNVISKLKDEYLAYPANYIFSYSNLGYDLLGQLIENVTPGTYAAYMKSDVFGPLKMNNTYVETKDDTINYSKAYEWNHLKDEGKIRDLPAGTIISNVKDISNFMKMVFANGYFENKMFLDSLTIIEMMTPQYPNAGIGAKTGSEIGLPWFFSIPNGNIKNTGKILYYGGSSSVFNSRIILLPEYKMGVVVLTNSASGRRILDKLCKEVLTFALKEKYGINTKQAVKYKIKRNPKIDFTDYSGDYVMGGGGIQKVTASRNKIKTEFKGRKINLLPNNQGSLNARIKLLGFVPVTIKKMNFNACEVNGEKIIYTSDWVLGTKLKKVDISDKWTTRTGEYKLLNQGEDCLYLQNCKLLIENGYLIFKAGGWDIFHVLNPISDSQAISMGIGRDKQETIYITIDKEGNEILNVSGYELQKMDE